MGRPKKQIKEEIIEKEPIICQEELNEEINNEENTEDNTKSAEILVGDNIKIVVRGRCYEVYEKKKVKTKDELGVETEVEKFKSQEVYFSNLIHTCDYIKQHLAKNKMYKRGIIKSLDEAIKIIKESYKETHKMFEGIKDV